ncbi:HlyC/CorC family transporter [Treponema sp. OMZ 840]|uniref:hemolysin family protein n=1 Tax=Treponema sp. OMZ 840 TaxID=244313 RepID=UPI003D91FA96
MNDGSFSNVVTLLVVIGTLVFIFFSMMFSAAETAFFSLNKLRLRFLRDKKHRGALKAGKLLDNKNGLLNTVLIGNNIVNIGLSVMLTSFAMYVFGPEKRSLSVGLSSLTATVLLLIFGEIIPKTVAARYPERIAFKLASPVRFFSYLFNPLVRFFTAVSAVLIKFFGIKINDSSVSFTEEEIKTFIEVGGEEGLINAAGEKMMHRVFTFTDLEAQDIMVPRTEIVSICHTASYTDILELSQKSHLSRFPVIGKDIDDIVGVLYVKDVLLYSGDKKAFSVKKIMRPPLFILETKSMTSIQQTLYEKNQTIAVVLDEYSGTAGILTKEDIAEEIFGTINDEYYTPDSEKNVSVTEKEMLISGKTRLIDLSERMGIKLYSDFNETIAGFIMEKLDAVPAVGDSIVFEGRRFTVNAMSGMRVRRVHIKIEDNL